LAPFADVFGKEGRKGREREEEVFSIKGLIFFAI